MLSKSDFEKKHLVFTFMNEGEKISFSNDNIVIKDKDGKLKHQSTCYRILALFVVGNLTITSGLIQRSKKFCFPIFLMNANLKTYDVIGFKAEGNTKLHERQYAYAGDEIAIKLICNKVANQRAALMRQRNKSDSTKQTIQVLQEYEQEIKQSLSENNVHKLMGREGSAARAYFREQFNNAQWQGRKPRIKADYINATLDIGYTLLFNYIEALLRIFGFDVYVGILHKEFYMRKSLVCDLVEPFRPLIDLRIRKAISLGQCKESDFEVKNHAYVLKREEQKRYTLFLLEPIIENQMELYAYVKQYYQCFMRNAPIEQYPYFEMGCK